MRLYRIILHCWPNFFRLASRYTETMTPMMMFFRKVTKLITPSAAPLRRLCMEGTSFVRTMLSSVSCRLS